LEALVGPLFMRTFLLFEPIPERYLASHVDLVLAAIRSIRAPRARVRKAKKQQ